jgi:hypothetical protein
MLNLDVVTEFVYGHFEQVKVTRNGTHFLCRCPLCGDSKKNKFKKRFNLDYNHGVPGWRCFNCDRHGNFYDIYSMMKGISYEDAVDRLKDKDWKRGDKRRTDKIKKRVENKKIEEEKNIEYSKYNWIKADSYSIPQIESGECRTDRYTDALIRFYEERKIPISYPLYICHSGKYRNRIIIPVLDSEGDIIYFQGRRIPDTGLEPKFKNPPDPKEIVIMNEHLFVKGETIIVMEGVTDTTIVGTQATTCLGKYISEEFLARLFTYTKDIIIAMDNDEPAYTALSAFMVDNKYSNKVRYFLYPDKYFKYGDLGDIAENEDVDMYSLILSNTSSYYQANLKLSILQKI